MKPKTVFLCGDHSPYGWAHFEPVLASFDVKLVVFASPTVWARFRKRGSPRVHSPSNPVGIWPTYVDRFLNDLRESSARRRRLKKLSSRGIPSFVASDINAPECLRMFEKAGADHLVTAAYPQIFKAPLLACFPHRAVNFHPSLLPRYRGAHPHYWCIVNGESETGTTSHLMTTGIDDGPIIDQICIPINNQSYPELYSKLIDATPALVRRTAERLATPGFNATPQDESVASCFRQNTDDDHRIRWKEMDARNIVNLVRAGRAWTTHGNHVVHIQHIAIESGPHSMADTGKPPGCVLDVESGSIWIASRDSAPLRITRCRYHLGPLRLKIWRCHRLIHIGEVLGDS